ncbi:DUF2536 family protein [Jeotgalibacillus proteolyticus]|uniref:DUF2536 domain-containing protein n=1 Tax=Jeotgalibacillus proteolyticus TaxID=2082395 RepID=A0A2S5GES3_9BACL|nr:DUF2536 family protein [Jeotgalibacillus proteolyticus]PPA71489.1 DUF2536 domain-containing protein [Jeotgalibacillus proteolyticus]
MAFTIEKLEDKVEFYEAYSIQELEKKIEQQISYNQAILLKVHSVSHQVIMDDKGRPFYTAVVHYKS